MQIYIWRHSKKFSSWSMMDEPHVCRKNYMQAEVAVLASSQEEALQLLDGDDQWDINELKRLTPEIKTIDNSFVISKNIFSG